MALTCDKWVALKIVEFCMCVACLVAKRVSTDDEARLALLLQKLSREWSLLTSVTWDAAGGAFADAVYGGYVIITFGLLVARVVREIPQGRRILEGILLGFGVIFFIVLGGLELASLDSVPRNLIVNASVLGSFSLVVAALFLLDLMGPRIYKSTRQSQTDIPIAIKSPKHDKKISIISQPVVSVPTNGVSNNGTTGVTNGTTNGVTNGATNGLSNAVNKGQQTNDKANGHVAPERPKDLDLNKTTETRKIETALFDEPILSFPKFDDNTLEKDILEKSKFGSLRSGMEGGNYVRLSDPMAEPDRLHYEQELAKFNEKYFRNYFEMMESKLAVRAHEDYLPELQTPVFAKVKTGRIQSLYDDSSPTYDHKRRSPSKSPSRAKTVTTPTLQQLEDYLRSSNRSKRADTPALFPMEPIQEKDKESGDQDGRASGTPTDPGYVQYTAGRWPDKRDIKTPRSSPK